MKHAMHRIKFTSRCNRELNTFNTTTVFDDFGNATIFYSGHAKHVPGFANNTQYWH